MNIPIVSLDKIYIRPDNKNIFFLDCTRVNNTNEIIGRRNKSLDEQIRILAEKLKGREIIIADDVVFSGNVLKLIISKLKKYNIKVVGVISGISTEEGYSYFNSTLKYGIRCNYILGEDVIDQICERDFYFGIAGSGIMIKTDNGYLKAPYFKPFGSPNERASIPKEKEDMFSKGCIERSIMLWKEIENKRKRKILMKDLPERIIGTEENEEVIKVLKKSRRRI